MQIVVYKHTSDDWHQNFITADGGDLVGVSLIKRAKEWAVTAFGNAEFAAEREFSKEKRRYLLFSGHYSA